MPNNSTVRALAISSTHCSSSSSKSSRWVSSRLWMFLWVTLSTISCRLSSASSTPSTSSNLMPSEDWTYTRALELPPLNIMELGPPALSISFLDMNCPRAMNSTTGSTQVSRMFKSGEVSSTISPPNCAPESWSRFTRSGSFIRPVL